MWSKWLIIFICISCPTHPGSQAVLSDTIHPWNGLHTSNHQKLINLFIKFEPVDLPQIGTFEDIPRTKHHTSTTGESPHPMTSLTVMQ